MSIAEMDRYQLSLFLSKIGSKDEPPPVILPAIPAVSGEDFLRWLANTVPLHKTTTFHLYINDDRTKRFRGGSVGWSVVGKLVIPA